MLKRLWKSHPHRTDWLMSSSSPLMKDNLPVCFWRSLRHDMNKGGRSSATAAAASDGSRSNFQKTSGKKKKKLAWWHRRSALWATQRGISPRPARQGVYTIIKEPCVWRDGASLDFTSHRKPVWSNFGLLCPLFIFGFYSRSQLRRTGSMFKGAVSQVCKEHIFLTFFLSWVKPSSLSMQSQWKCCKLIVAKFECVI